LFTSMLSFRQRLSIFEEAFRKVSSGVDRVTLIPVTFRPDH